MLISSALQITGEALVQRKDDNVDALKARLVSFHKQTAPVIDFYRSKGVFTSVNADQQSDRVWAQIAKALTQSK